MIHENGHFEGKDNTKIFYQYWVPDEVKGVVIISHGFAEHSGRYMNVVDTLVPEGYSIWALDHRGQGKSDGKINYVRSFTDYIEDLKIFEELVRDNNPNQPMFLLGHSMGSIIANNFMARYTDQTKFKSLILSGTGAAPGPEINKVAIILSKVLSTILPKISIPSGVDPNFISHDQEVINAYKQDPLVRYDKITSRLGSEFMKYTLKMKESANEITIPTLIQIGGEDTTFHPDSWESFFETFKNDNKSLHIYDGYRHEVYNEVEKQALIDLKNWLNSFY